MLVVTTASSPLESSPALTVLVGYSAKLGLRPLDRGQIEQLLASVFGDVPNVSMIAERIQALALGRPRECMALAQHLIDRGVIAYRAGSWTLPEQLAPGDLPTRGDEVFGARVRELSARSRRLHCTTGVVLRDAAIHGRGDPMNRPLSNGSKLMTGI